MDITVNGLTVRIEERDPKTVNPRQNSTQKMKRRKTISNLAPAVGPADAVQVSGLNGSNVSESNMERTFDRSTTETTATQRAEQIVVPPEEDVVDSLPPSQQASPPTSSPLLPQRSSEVLPEVCN